MFPLSCWPKRVPTRPVRNIVPFSSLVGILALLASLLPPGAARAQSPTSLTSGRLARPRGTLDQPVDPRIFLGLYGQVGGGFHFDQGQPGGGAFLLFRPGAAAGFLDFLYGWNAGLLLQVDYQKLAAHRRIFSGDLVIRHYRRDMRRDENPVSPFVGFGLGASEVLVPSADGNLKDAYWSLLVELGQEWAYRRDNVLFVKAQLRRYDFGGLDYSSWSIQAGGGIPLPW